jgi:GntR family transcriptional repressor for pyruvate dehydrogenase complex
MSRTDSIAAHLRDEILRGAYQPGERLPAERDLAGLLAANRTSVREALKKLEFVAIRRGGGARVCHVHEASIDVVRHLLRVNGAIDPSLAFQILDVNEIMLAGATRLAVERASDAELAEARELLRRLTAADGAVDERVEIIDALFELITRASQNLVLRMLHRTIRPALTGELGRLTWQALSPTRGALHAQIRAIDGAIAARDPLSAEEAVRAMLRHRRSRLVAILEEPSDRGPRPECEDSNEY